MKMALVIVVMGVSGAGKTVVGKALAQKLNWRFLEGDDFHPNANIEKMRQGVPLSDADREPWLQHVNFITLRVRVNGISPGAIRTPINRTAWETPEAEAELIKLIPYERIGDPMDIGHTAVWLASDASDYVTGTTLYVDGGMTLYPGFREGG